MYKIKYKISKSISFSDVYVKFKDLIFAYGIFLCYKIRYREKGKIKIEN